VLNDLSTKQYELDKEGKRYCSNCEALPKMLEIMGGMDEAVKHTIFAINCQNYY